MTISASAYAAMASASYGPSNGEDPLVKMIDFSDGALDDGSFSVLEYTDAYSVFRKTDSGEVVVAIKGTNSIGDWASNALIMVGALGSDPRTTVLVDLVRKYKKQGVDVSVTGHSLGGALAAELVRNEHVMGVTFNKGSGFAESMSVSQISAMLRGERTGSLVNFVTGVDPLSVLTLVNPKGHSGVHYIRPSLLNVHAMDNFKGMDSSLYEADLKDRSERARVYRIDHKARIKVEPVTPREKRLRVYRDALKAKWLLARMKTIYDNGENILKNYDQIPQNFVLKLQSIRRRVNTLIDSIKRVGRSARSEVIDAGELFDDIEALVEDSVALYEDTTVNSFIRDLVQDNRGGEAGGGDIEMDEFGLDEISPDGDIPPDEFLDEFDADLEGDFADVVEDVEVDLPQEVLDDFGAYGEGDFAEVVEDFEVELPQEILGDFSEFIGDGLVEGVEAAAVEGVAAEVALAVAAEVAAPVFAVIGVGYAINSFVNSFHDADELQKKWNHANFNIGHVNTQYDHMLHHKLLALHLDHVQRDSSIRSYPGTIWRNRDLYGAVSLRYLDWRMKNPSFFFPGDESELIVMGRLHRKWFSVGVPMFLFDKGAVMGEIMLNYNIKTDALQRWFETLDHKWDTKTYDLREGSFEWTPNGWVSFLDVYNKVTLYYAKQNKDGFTREFELFLRTHKKHNYADLTQGKQVQWLDQLEETLTKESRDYLVWVRQLPYFVRQLERENFGSPLIQRFLQDAMESFVAAVVHVLVTNGTKKEEKLIAFERTHSRTVLLRGLEEISSVHHLDLWLIEHGEHLGGFQVYFSLGSQQLLVQKPRSVDEQAKTRQMIEHQIEVDNLDWYSFRSDGQKLRGDNETFDEFEARFKRWQHNAALKRLLEYNTSAGVSPPVIDDMPVVGQYDDGSLCVYVPKKKKAVQTTPVAPKKRRLLAPSIAMS